MDVSAADLGDVLDAVIRELGMPQSLKDVGVGREKLDGLAENSLHDRWCISNPVSLREKYQGIHWTWKTGQKRNEWSGSVLFITISYSEFF